MGRLLALIAALAAAALIAWTTEKTPSPRPADAPASAFSAERAMADVRAIGSVPHPIGSAANHAARDHLVQRMAALGLSPQVRPGVGFVSGAGERPFLYGGSVENIVGVLPGRDRAAPALGLMAHYDSVPGSPGAADDAAGVAATLETVRAIKARGIPARDVVVLFTDGEEAGLLGAHAFFERDPMAKRIGFLFNTEARGGGGRVQMFQTGPRSGGAVAVLKAHGLNPQASSLTGYVYERMPNDTDFTLSRKAGVDGLNYAFLGRQFDYHSPSSTPDNLDRGTLQDMGQQVLANAAAVAFAPALPAKTPNPVYSQLLGGVTVTYPPAMGWLVLAVAAALAGFAVNRARRIEPFAWTDVARGLGAAVFAVVGAAAVLHFARRATGADYGYLEQRFLLAQVTRWEAAIVLLGLGFLVFAAAELARGRRSVAILPLLAGVGSCAFGGLDKLGLGLGVAAALLAVIAYGRPVSRAGAWTGVLVLGFVLAVVAQALAPPAAFILAWPLLLASLAAAASAMSARKGVATLILLGLLAALGLGWIGGFAHGVFLSLDLVELLAAPVLLAALLVWPLAQPEEGAPPARLVGPLLLAAGVAMLLAVRFAHPYDARHPELSYVGYQVDQDAGRAWRFSGSPTLPKWSEGVLKDGGGAITKLRHWTLRDPVDAAAAPFVQEAPPTLTLSKDPDGRLRLHAVPPPGARELRLRLSPNTAATVEEIAGVPVKMALRPGGQTRVGWVAAPSGVDLVIRPGGPGAIDVGYAATLERWPAGVTPLPKRPAAVMAFDTSDSTFVVGTRRFSW
ncbi:MAG: peptidase family [Phenylobacterium sp.]|nr:peptidase family [Phenylobacterium sp.]